MGFAMGGQEQRQVLRSMQAFSVPLLLPLLVITTDLAQGRNLGGRLNGAGQWTETPSSMLDINLMI